MLPKNGQTSDTNQDKTHSTDASAAVASDTHLAADVPAVPNYNFKREFCILDFNMGIDPVTFESTFSLRAVPYIKNDDPFLDLDQNASTISGVHRKKFYESLQAKDGSAILALLKKLYKRKPFLIDTVHYVPFCHGTTSGILAKEYLIDHKFGVDQYRSLKCFFSLIDLIIRNKLDINRDQLNVQLAYQKETYGIELDFAERVKLCSLLKKHPISNMQSDLHTYLLDKNVNKQEKSSGASSAFFSGWSTWVSGTSSSSQTLPPNAAVNTTPADLAQERINVVARLRADQYDNLSAQKQDLKRLFALRPYFKPDDAYCNRITMMNKRIDLFWQHMDIPECWQDPAVMKQARELIIEAMLISDEHLARMEHFLRQVGEQPTARNMAQLLANQRLSFCRTFIYSGIIDFYPKLRKKGWSESKDEQSEANKLFFTNGSAENSLRKLYNTFIEHGFNQRYGSDFRRELRAADSRFNAWSLKDSKVQEPIPETWLGFFQRSISGQKQPTKEKYTYSNPTNIIRPT